jgi:hypothetical protein
VILLRRQTRKAREAVARRRCAGDDRQCAATRDDYHVRLLQIIAAAANA